VPHEQESLQKITNADKYPSEPENFVARADMEAINIDGLAKAQAKTCALFGSA